MQQPSSYSDDFFNLAVYFLIKRHIYYKRSFKISCLNRNNLSSSVTANTQSLSFFSLIVILKKKSLACNKFRLSESILSIFFSRFLCHLLKKTKQKLKLVHMLINYQDEMRWKQKWFKRLSAKFVSFIVIKKTSFFAYFAYIFNDFLACSILTIICKYLCFRDNQLIQ